MKKIILKRVPEKHFGGCIGCHAQYSIKKCERLMAADTKKDCIKDDFIYEEVSK